MPEVRNLQSFQLSKSSSYVNYGGSGSVTLIPEQYVKVISWLVPRQEVLRLSKNPKVYLKLYDDDGSQIADNCKIMISIKKPTQELPQEIGTFKQYFQYSDLSINDQNNIKYDSSTRFEMDNEGYFPQEAELQVLVYSPVSSTIDWDNVSTKIAIGETGKNDLQRGEYK